MIRILFFADALRGGGAEKALCNLVSRLDKSRFQITVHTLQEEENADVLPPEVTYRAVNRAKTPLGRWLMHQWLRLCAQLKWVYPLYLRGDYDIEIAWLECGPTKMLAGSTNKQAVKLAWVHCDLAKKPGIDPKRVGKYYAAYHKVVCVSEAVKDSFAALFGTKPEAVVLPNIVNEQEIRRKALAFAPERPKPLTIAAVGRLSYEKGFDRLIAACSMLKQEGLSFALWLIGEGPQRPLLEEMIARERLEDTVFLMGYAENPYPYMAKGDFLVCSSLFEGASTVAAEALILGTPVVSTPCAGMAELFGDLPCGVITGDNAAGIAAGMRQLLTDEDLLRCYTVMAQQRGSGISGAAAVEKIENFFCRAQ